MPFLAEAWSWQQTLMMAIGVLVVAAVMLRASRQRLNATRGGSSSAGGATRMARSAENVRDQLDALMVQLEELARATTAQIETRYAKLESLLDDADRKIAKLESLLAAEPRPEARGGEATASEQIKPEHRRIYELADAGRTPVQIAQETARDVGEVELILALRKK